MILPLFNLDVLLVFLAFGIVALLVKIAFLTPSSQHLFQENARLQTEQEYRAQELGRISAELAKVTSTKDNIEGKQQQLSRENTDLRNESQKMREENDRLRKELAERRASEEKQKADEEQRIQKLEEARKTLEDEKQRIRKEDEDRQQAEQEERNRIWSAHEQNVITSLKELCRKPEIDFSFYENTNLPEEFDGNIKPDFLVEFDGQYVVFDAKFSNQKNPQTYFSDQTKKTAVKYKGNSHIFSTIFFVVPDNRIAELKKLSFVEQDFLFSLLPVSALEPVLVNIRKMADVFKITDFDPRDREAIIRLVAGYDRHIGFQNAANILLIRESIELMRSQESLSSHLQESIALQKDQMRALRLKDSDIKRLSRRFSEQESEIETLTASQAPIISREMLSKVASRLHLSPLEE